MGFPPITKAVIFSAGQLLHHFAIPHFPEIHSLPVHHPFKRPARAGSALQGIAEGCEARNKEVIWNPQQFLQLYFRWFLDGVPNRPKPSAAAAK